MTEPSAAGVVYEVNLEVDAHIEDSYRNWLDAHVMQVLALPGFVSAQRFEVVDPPARGPIGLCVHYRLRDAEALQAYLREHAPRLRAEGIERFGDQVRASRRVLRTDGAILIASPPT